MLNEWHSGGGRLSHRYRHSSSLDTWLYATHETQSIDTVIIFHRSTPWPRSISTIAR